MGCAEVHRILTTLPMLSLFIPEKAGGHLGGIAEGGGIAMALDGKEAIVSADNAHHLFRK